MTLRWQRVLPMGTPTLSRPRDDKVRSFVAEIGFDHFVRTGTNPVNGTLGLRHLTALASRTSFSRDLIPESENTSPAAEHMASQLPPLTFQLVSLDDAEHD